MCFGGVVKNVHRVLTTEPAGEGVAVGGQQADKGRPQGSSPEACIIVTNDRDRRALAWLRAQVGDAAVMGAVGQLAGARKPYVSNVAKVLGLALPAVTTYTDHETARERLAAIRRQLGR